LQELSEVADVRINFSIGSMDEQVWKTNEPGAPGPMARMEAIQFLVENGITAGVMMAPLLPGISDSEVSINEVAAAAAEHKAQFLGANVLFLKPGSKEWFMPMLRETYPHLTTTYDKMYRKTYAPKDYTSMVLKAVDKARWEWGLQVMEPTKNLRGQQRQLELALTA
jgi:DNA repair photolyase